MRGIRWMALAGVTLLGAGAARAEDAARPPPAREQAEAPRGAERVKRLREAHQREREVLGRVLLVERDSVFLMDRAGVITRLALGAGTHVEGSALRGTHDLEAGHEVRATYEWKGADGVATRIRLVPTGTVEREGTPPADE